ncbi:MAG: sigma-54-dependent Fis family transcriptional regulator [Salinivirgaceae bacterium]|mgnify:CR=1 FL=1|nr:MAG: sigma-54-dependent Fis family transcriptional regulator [Salinivirgaceae bacterium]
MNNKILIVDDKKSVLTALEMLLQTEFDEILTLNSPKTLISTIEENKVDVVLLDMNFKSGINNGNEGIFWLNEILKFDPSIVVIMITAFGDVELAVKAVKEGAFNFILKPWDNQKLLSTLHSAIKLRKSKVENSALKKVSQNLKQEINPNNYRLIGKSKAILDIMEIVKKVAVTDANILITGENGTGKELIAREIHKYSKRQNEILLTVDMGAVSETLFESELFGHKKGAYTDAKEERIGKFETANNGTIFLDEIGNLSLPLQAKMLSVLQNRTITKLGDNHPIPINIRLISATNKDIDAMIAEGTFREDLLYRINTISIELPPLRERENDVLLLAEFFLDKYAKKYDKKGLKITDKAKSKLLKHNWPGNVRELQHSVEKAVILSDNSNLNEECFSLNQNTAIPNNRIGDLTIEEMEKEMIINCIETEKGNMSSVSKKLGITRQTLYNKLKKYDL